LRLGLMQLRLERLRIHRRDNLPFFHEVAFGHEHVLNAAGQFAGDIDLRGFDASVGNRQTRRKRRRLHVPPGEAGGRGD
jgi:hypothetical protein